MPKRIVRSRRKRPTKWCGVVTTGSVPDSDSLIVADSTNLCPVTTAANDSPDPVVGWCKGYISTSRLLGSMPTPACAWAIVLQTMSEATGDPLQVFNPWDQTDLERQSILGMGHMAVPPIVLTPSNDTIVTQRQTTVTEINIKVGRKVLRNNQSLFLWFASTDEAAPGTDNAFQVIASIRTLMKFA